jgi:hypothetical protein
MFYERPKVRNAQAENQDMENRHPIPFESDDPVFLHAQAVSLAVRTIRKAQGKATPRDCLAGTTEWHSALEEFAHDLLRALDAENGLGVPATRRCGDPDTG